MYGADVASSWGVNSDCGGLVGLDDEVGVEVPFVGGLGVEGRVLGFCTIKGAMSRPDRGK